MTAIDGTGNIQLGQAGTTATLRISRPPLNLLTVDFFRSLRVALSQLAEAPELRALVITGSDGGPFSAGSDMSEFAELGDDATEKKILVENLALMDLEAFAVPTIAAIEGYAMGGGLELALACDLRVVAADARLSLPEGRIGGLASNGAQRLTLLLGPARASQMLFLGEEVDGAESERIGLANWAVAPGEAYPFALDVARRIAELGSLSVRRAKRLIRGTTASHPDAFVRSVRAQEAIFAGEELTEGVAAFFEKRPPDFGDRTGREEAE